MSRSCDGCTKCCDGWLAGEVNGHEFYPGRPCHYSTSDGCSIYASRPTDPCVKYTCLWKSSDEVPGWMKPSDISLIADERKTDGGIPYVSLHEAGSQVDSRVLTWWFEWALSKGANLMWEVHGGKHYIGTPDFVAEMDVNQYRRNQENAAVVS